MQALKFITCGSVDDGKSTLIGRMLEEIQQMVGATAGSAQMDVGNPDGAVVALFDSVGGGLHIGSVLPWCTAPCCMCQMTGR